MLDILSDKGESGYKVLLKSMANLGWDDHVATLTDTANGLHLRLHYDCS